MCNVSRSKKAKYKMTGIENSGYSRYALMALKTTKAPGVAPVAGEAPNTNTGAVDTSGDKFTISSSPRQEPTKAEQLIELIRSHKNINAVELRENLNSNDSEVSQKATEQYKVLSNLYGPIRNQSEAFQQVYKDADGFIYIAGRGLEPYSSSSDGKYPTKDALEKQADEALKQYLSVSSPISADSKLAHINATGKEPTPEEQVEIAGLLKQEIEQTGSLSDDEIRNIKNQLGDAHVGLIPDKSPLKKVVGGLIDDLNNSSSRNKEWFKAFGLLPWPEASASRLSEQAEQLKQRIEDGKSIIYPPEYEQARRYLEEESALT
jgi:hypothetical protein